MGSEDGHNGEGNANFSPFVLKLYLLTRPAPKSLAETALYYNRILEGCQRNCQHLCEVKLKCPFSLKQSQYANPLKLYIFTPLYSQTSLVPGTGSHV